jgi:hypothetical protein
MYMFTMLKQRSGSNMEIPKSFLGYKRENGRAGTRNHVIILPVDDISNACAEAVANNIKGTIALPHSYGRLQFGADLELHFRTMIGTGCNPNVAAVIVIGIEPKWTKKIVDGIAKTGKPVEGFHIERTGDIGTTMKLADGTATITLTWANGAPDSASFEVLWSKESMGGNWMLRMEDLPNVNTAATCDDGGTDPEPEPEPTGVNLVMVAFSIAKRGKSGLHRKKYQVIPGRSNSRDSATENRPPNQGKGETVR